MADSFPAHWGMKFTPTIHQKAEGPTDPANVTLPPNFTVCVTGAGKGLGYHIALAYARAGAKNICISSRTRADLDKLAAEIAELGESGKGKGEGKGEGEVEVLVQTCDTMKDEEVKTLAGMVWERWGRCDVVVANAGVISKYVSREDGREYLPVGVVEDGDLERVVETNLMGTWRVAKYFIPHLAATSDGPQAYVCITSIAAHMRDSAVTPFAYNLSKIGLNRMVEHIAVDHKEQGIQAFAVHPGAVLTPQTEMHHTTQMGERWTDLLTDDIGLCGGFLTWLTSERRDWLSGRYLSVNWDVRELEGMKDEIVAKDKLKFQMVV